VAGFYGASGIPSKLLGHFKSLLASLGNLLVDSNVFLNSHNFPFLNWLDTSSDNKAHNNRATPFAVALMEAPGCLLTRASEWIRQAGPKYKVLSGFSRFLVLFGDKSCKEPEVIRSISLLGRLDPTQIQHYFLSRQVMTIPSDFEELKYKNSKAA